MFATAVLAELDTQTGMFRWVNAGHPEPLLLRGGRLVKSLQVRPRPPLGVDLRGSRAAPVPAVGTEALEPGDSVLLYTDGVTDARSPSGEFFGEERLADMIVRNMASGLPAPETMRRVVQALLAHQAGNLHDDASLALVQWPGNPGSLLPETG
jgi:serine phosphatase RsbU (regulator of sigma subunit)